MRKGFGFGRGGRRSSILRPTKGRKSIMLGGTRPGPPARPGRSLLSLFKRLASG